MPPLLIESVSPLGQAGRLGLKEGDVIIAKDFEEIKDNPQEFTLSLYSADSILTVCRGSKYFDVHVKKGLALNLDNVSMSDSIQGVLDEYDKREFDIPKDKLKNYNILSFMDELIVIRTETSFFPALLPPIWLLSEGLFLQSLAVGSVYFLSYLVHQIIFIGVCIVGSIYFYRNQIETLLTDKYLKGCQPLIVIASDSEKNAKEKAKELFPRDQKKSDKEQAEKSF